MISIIMPALFAAAVMPVWAQNAQENYGSGGMLTGTVAEEVVAGSEGTITNAARHLLLPLKQTDISIEMIPGVISADVRQLFFNDSGEYIEANYIFPLPADATISEMVITINQDRVIRSVVRERQEAKKTYEAAKKAGKRTALLNRNSGNMLNMKIANLAPGDSAEVHIVYFQATSYDNGVYHLIVPTVIAPQYVPNGFLAENNSASASRIEAVADNLNAPRLPPGVASDHHFSFSATFAGMEIRRITSPSHAIDVSSATGATSLTTITLVDELSFPDRDVLIDIAVEDPESLAASFLTSEIDGSFYTVASVVPSFEAAPIQQIQKREIIFVIDTSGSMNGSSIKQAKRGVISALKYLKSEDRFSILEFNSKFSSLIEYAAATKLNLGKAEALVNKLASTGGTEFLPVIKHILARVPAADEKRMVVFLTDGQSCQEDEVLRAIMADTTGTKFFPICIGSAPNTALLKKMAERGRGCLTRICDMNEIASEIENLFAKLQNPVMVDIDLQLVDQWGAPVKAEIFPSVFPDVFAGLPVTCNISHELIEDIYLEFTGYYGGETKMLRYKLPSQTMDSIAGAQIFGQSMIADLDAQLLIAENESERKLIKESVLQTALDFQLVCRYTSRVAVEELIEKDPDGKLRYVPVPLHTPAGALESTATSDWLHMLAGLLLLSAVFALMPAARAMKNRGISVPEVER